MDDKTKGRSSKAGPDESWVERLGGKGAENPTGASVYLGLLRESPNDSSAYQLFLSLDLTRCLYIQKDDVVYWENLPAEKSPFGSLGGCRVYVRHGATITSVRTSTQTFETRPAADPFDLDIRLGSQRPADATDQTIPETGCGPDCETIPPFTDGCQVLTANCTLDNTCLGCIPTQQGKTCGANCQVTRSFTCNTCPTNCATCPQTNCATCQTNCGTCATNCGTCATHCGTCRINTCNTKCGQETCGPCTHIFTQCNQHGCSPA